MMKTETPRLIDLMIVGAQKAGTSSLKAYLGGHPDLWVHRTPEFTYFVHDPEFLAGYPAAFRRHFGDDRGTARTAAKSVGIFCTPTAIQRLHEHNPTAQIVLVLRDPIRRALSSYWYARRMGWETLGTFEEAIDAPADRFTADPLRQRNCAYLDGSLYAKHLEALLAVFPRERVTTFLFEELRDDPAGVCEAIFRLVGLPRADVVMSGVHNKAAMARSPGVARFLGSRHLFKRAVASVLPRSWARYLRRKVQKLNERSMAPPPLNAATRERLRDFFQGPNAALGTLLDRDLSAWNE